MVKGVYMEKQQELNINQIVLTMDDNFSQLPVSAMLAKSTVPYSHRRIADNYVMLKKIYGFQVSQPRITNAERNKLYLYNFNTLENTTIGQINIELSLLKEWSMSTDIKLRNDSEDILKIRVKELKFILSNKYALTTNEVHNGYKAIELYLSEITKFYSGN